MGLNSLHLMDDLRYDWNRRGVCGRKQQCVEIEGETVPTFRLAERKTARFQVVGFSADVTQSFGTEKSELSIPSSPEKLMQEEFEGDIASCRPEFPVLDHLGRNCVSHGSLSQFSGYVSLI